MAKNLETKLKEKQKQSKHETNGSSRPEVVTRPPARPSLLRVLRELRQL